MKIIVDTREQNPLWDEEKDAIIKQKLDEGDYTTEDLLGKAHIERKSGNDLYGSLIQGHERFRNEIQRANEKGLRLAVFVECDKRTFVGKKFKGGFRLKCKPAVLAKILETFSKKYEIEFVWCKDREDFRRKALEWFDTQRKSLLSTKRHRAEFVHHDLGGRPVAQEVKKPKAGWK
jgi:ERCC4-type nuclease